MLRQLTNAAGPVEQPCGLQLFGRGDDGRAGLSKAVLRTRLPVSPTSARVIDVDAKSKCRPHSGQCV